MQRVGGGGRGGGTQRFPPEFNLQLINLNLCRFTTIGNGLLTRHDKLNHGDVLFWIFEKYEKLLIWHDIGECKLSCRLGNVDWQKFAIFKKFQDKRTGFDKQDPSRLRYTWVTVKI